ncbi:uncharacterized protein RSE6_07010 [Rhynchosporium secalis]|uniref:Tetraspanin Tsp3 n=1 Tax=Rhynchosporium secalis TaxID=38038 RepID=A0A1E1MBZ6_RHYSE|nr:uncharacterized protein RSE6_07010 [Rhynchosporium secalis]
MSPNLKNLGLFAVPLLLLLLTAIAGYAYTQIRSLSLPIPQALALFTVILPLITGISAQGTYGVIRRSANNTQYQLTIPLIAVIGVQMIYETVIATLALTHMVPPDSLICGLESKWQQFWSAHDIKAGDSIRTIQDALNCCGFNSLKDRSWPRAEQINAGLLLLVALTVFIIKVLSLLSLLTSTSFSQSKWARPFKQIGNIADVEDVNGSGEDNRATVRRLIEENVEEYHDEPSTTHSTSAINAQEREQDHGPRVQPSPLTDGGSEWRD